MESSLTGKGGKSFQDRELAAKVRSLALEEIHKVLKLGEGDLYKQLLIRLAGTVLPRLNEVTGQDGEAIVIELIQYGNSANTVQLSAKDISAPGFTGT